MATLTRKKAAKTPRRTPPSDRTMRLPHEQDESSRASRPQSAQRPARVMRAAHEDLKQGKLDTDVRGNASREAFNTPADDTTTARDGRRTGAKSK